MPVELILARAAKCSTRARLSCSLGSALIFLSACNGQAAFVEQSRTLKREVSVASADADARARLGVDATASATGREGPVNRNKSEDEDGIKNAHGGGSQDDDGLKNEHAGSPQGEDGMGVGVDESNRRPPQMPDPAQLPQPPSDPSGQTPPNSDVARGDPQRQQPVPQPQQPVKNGPRAGETVIVQQTQPRAKVDILWVVDSSGSMAWAQNQLKSKFQSFAQKLKETRIDFQVGVTSLDVCQTDSTTGYAVANALCPSATYIPDAVKVGGKFVGSLRGSLQADPGSKKTILRDMPDFVEAFQRTALLGTKGSAFEHGLWAAKMAVEKSLPSGGENAGFVRPDASLSVIVLSDEEDDSVQMWCEDSYGRTSLDANGQKDANLCREGGSSPFLDAFGIAPYALMKSTKGVPLTTHKFTADQFNNWAADANVKGSGNFRVSAITGLRKQNGSIDCSMSTGGPEESGTNYIKAAQLTGGAVENICSSDWSSVLTNVGQNTVELATRISLPAGKIPFSGTLEVTVDGQVLDAMHYVYDASLHAVVFKSPPAMGAEVVVNYRETLVD